MRDKEQDLLVVTPNSVPAPTPLCFGWQRQGALTHAGSEPGYLVPHPALPLNLGELWASVSLSGLTGIRRILADTDLSLGPGTSDTILLAFLHSVFNLIKSSSPQSPPLSQLTPTSAWFSSWSKCSGLVHGFCLSHCLLALHWLIQVLALHPTPAIASLAPT